MGWQVLAGILEFCRQAESCVPRAQYLRGANVPGYHRNERHILLLAASIGGAVAGII